MHYSKNKQHKESSLRYVQVFAYSYPSYLVDIKKIDDRVKGSVEVIQ